MRFFKKRKSVMYGVDASLDGKHISIFITDEKGIENLIRNGYTITRKERIV